MDDPVPPGVRLGIVGGISYRLFGKPDTFVPQLRELGAALVRVCFHWSQVEPEPGRWSFDAVDVLLGQLDGSEEVWVTVCSRSPWATRQATGFLPPRPPRTWTPTTGSCSAWCATAPGGALVAVRQPALQRGLLWAGTAAEYLAQLRVEFETMLRLVYADLFQLSTDGPTWPRPRSGRGHAPTVSA